MTHYHTEQGCFASQQDRLANDRHLSIVAGRKTKVRREKNQGCAKENNADAKA
jgi:hypothetical protein